MFRNRRNREDPITGPAPHPSGVPLWLAGVRSAVFNVAFFTVLPLLMVLNIPALLFKTPPYYLSKICSTIALWFSRVICGLDYKIIGLENVPAGACVLASKHQSAWDTIVFSTLYPDCSYVLKHELTKVPIYGTFIRKLGMISIDRNRGRKAILDLREQAHKIVNQDRKIIIFPEGTRTTPDDPKPYQKGVLSLYKDFNCPVIPVALNSGLFWGRRSWIKWPGEITLEFLPPCPPA